MKDYGAAVAEILPNSVACSPFLIFNSSVPRPLKERETKKPVKEGTFSDI
jgi:hypothetical protein